jgi:hypothetical protein
MTLSSLPYIPGSFVEYFIQLIYTDNMFYANKAHFDKRSHNLNLLLWNRWTQNKSKLAGMVFGWFPFKVVRIIRNWFFIKSLCHISIKVCSGEWFMLVGASSYVLFLFEKTIFWSIHLLKITNGISYQFRFTTHFACHWILLFILQAIVFCYLFFRPLNFAISPEEYEAQAMKKTKVSRVRYIIFIRPHQSIWIQLNFQRKGYWYICHTSKLYTS